jgi:argininosuccinate lyase
MTQNMKTHPVTDKNPGGTEYHAPIWDRGGTVDAQLMAFTIGDDWRMDRQLVEHDIRGSQAHAAGLLAAGLISGEDQRAISVGLAGLLDDWHAGQWDLGPGDEDVHSAVERHLVERIGEAGKRLHTGRSRNEQVALDMLLWLRSAAREMADQVDGLSSACCAYGAAAGGTPLPGYTHLRRALPSTVAEWAAAHGAAFAANASELTASARQRGTCPMGSGSGYGVPLNLARETVAEALGFEGPTEPVTLVQHQRGRAELAYLTLLEALALDLGKLAADLWLFTSEEFGFFTLPEELTTGSSLMPQKRNPDLVELLRGVARTVIADRAALLDVLRDLPSGYHRDFQLIKPPLFGAQEKLLQALPLCARLVTGLELNREALTATAADPALLATARALERAAAGEAFRDAYRAESTSSI